MSAANPIFTFDREAIFKALFEVGTRAYQWNGAPSRRVKLWTEVPSEMRPAFFQQEAPNEHYEWKNSSVPIVTMDAAWIMYTNAKDKVGSIEVNKILNGIHNALMPSGKDAFTVGKQTLGGLVYWARIQGDILREPGDLDNDGLIRVPIKIIVNS